MGSGCEGRCHPDPTRHPVLSSFGARSTSEKNLAEATDKRRGKDFFLLHLNPSNCDVDDQYALSSLMRVILRLPRLCSLALNLYLSTLLLTGVRGRLVHGDHGVHSIT